MSRIIFLFVIFCFFVGSLSANKIESLPKIEKSDEGDADIDPYEISDEDVDPYEIAEEDEGDADIDPYEISDEDVDPYEIAEEDEGDADIDPYEISDEEEKEQNEIRIYDVSDAEITELLPNFLECKENKKCALALYVSCKKGEQEEEERLVLEKITKDLEQLSQSCEIYICPKSCDEIAWAMSKWPTYNILLQPKGTSLQQMQQTTNFLLQRGYEKVSLVLNPYTCFPKTYIEKSFHLLNENKFVMGSLKGGDPYLVSTKTKWPHIAKERSYGPITFNNCMSLLKSQEGKGQELPIWYAPKTCEEMSTLAKQFISEKEQQRQIQDWVYQNIKVSIVIPICNEETRIEGLVNELRALSPRPQLIFVDGGSKDKTVDLLSSLHQEVHFAPGCTRAAQLNMGSTLALGEYILFLHPNCFLPQDSYSKMLIILASTQIEAGAFSLKLQGERRNPILKVLEKGSALRCKMFKMAYGNQGYFITKKALDRVGPYKEIPIMEDVEWFGRVKKECIFTVLKDPIENLAKRPHEKGHIYSSIKNCCLVSLYKIGVKPERLSKVSNYKKGYQSSF